MNIETAASIIEDDSGRAYYLDNYLTCDLKFGWPFPDSSINIQRTNFKDCAVYLLHKDIVICNIRILHKDFELSMYTYLDLQVMVSVTVGMLGTNIKWIIESEDE